MARISVQEAGGQNIVAFLDMIAWSELGQYVIDGSDDGYNVLVGSTPSHILTFPSYNSHPDILNHALNSTAAGRYQLLFKYYAPYCKLLGLSNFGPVNQDRIAIQQIKERHAIPMIQQGDIEQAISACNTIWASLFGSPYNQHTNSLADLLNQYQAAGGTTS